MEDEALLRQPDKAGAMGRRTTSLTLQHEWATRWFCLRGEVLAWYDSKEGGARGRIGLRGAIIGTDDFGAHQAFTIIISRYDGKESPPIYLSTTSLREQMAWTRALERGASSSASSSAA